MRHITTATAIDLVPGEAVLNNEERIDFDSYLNRKDGFWSLLRNEAARCRQADGRCSVCKTVPTMGGYSFMDHVLTKSHTMKAASYERARKAEAHRSPVAKR